MIEILLIQKNGAHGKEIFEAEIIGREISIRGDTPQEVVGYLMLADPQRNGIKIEFHNQSKYPATRYHP